jgi:hypothetical protein
VKGAHEVLEHPEWGEKDDMGLAPLGASFQDREGRRQELLLAALAGKRDGAITPGPSCPVEHPSHLVVISGLLPFSHGHQIIGQKAVADAAWGSSPQDEQRVQRLGQAKFDLIIEDLPDGCSDEAVKETPVVEDAR